MPRHTAKRDLAAKVDHLFRVVRPRGGDEFSFEEAADAIRAKVRRRHSSCGMQSPIDYETSAANRAA